MNIGKKIRLILALTIVAVALVASGALANTLSYATKAGFPGVGNGSEISFTGGGSFTFVDPVTTGHDFGITGSNPAGSLAVGFIGDIEGTFNIGAITPGAGGLETAPVTTTNGTFTIIDGAGKVFSSTINWVSIYSLASTVGMNNAAVVNLANKSYSGNNVDLLGMLDNPTIVDMDLTFIPGLTLT
jgi:hypothetical protein